MPKSQLLLLSSMPRSGSTWMLRFLNELWVTKGALDYTELRAQYHLEKTMTGGSALIELSLPRLLPVLKPLWDGRSYAAKTHTSPNEKKLGWLSHLLLRYLASGKRLVTLYLYRDPRDAVLSGYEYGRRSIQMGKPNAFAETFETIEAGIDWMDRYMRTSYPYWRYAPHTLQVRYEDLLTNFAAESTRILQHLELDGQSEQVQAIVQKYQAGAAPQVGTHFYKGEIGRFRQEMTPEQLQLCEHAFARYLDEMGYSEG